MKRGSRKVHIFYVAVGALFAGLVLSVVPQVAAVYGSFVAGIGAVTAAAMAGNVGAHFAQRGEEPVSFTPTATTSSTAPLQTRGGP